MTSRTPDIDGGVFIEGTNGYPLKFDGTRNLRIRGPRIQYDGTVPAARDGISVTGKIGNADNVQIDDVQVSSSTGKLRSAVALAPRSGRSMMNLRITDIHSAGSAASGVYLSYHLAATADPSPLITGIDKRAYTVWTQADQNDNAITTVYPARRRLDSALLQVNWHRQYRLVASAHSLRP